MTIKLIKKGKPKANKPVVTLCTHCYAKFSFEKGDARLVCNQRDGDYYYVLCPDCRKLTGVAVHLTSWGYAQS